VNEVPATQMLPRPAAGRSYSAQRTVRLGDVDPDGVLRLDATARYLQDIASDDALDAALPNALGWVVRRTMIRVGQPGSVNERLDLTTFCTGAGRCWAERRTSIVGADGAAVEAVSLWVQVDVATGRPAKLGDAFFEIYGPAAAGRAVSSRLSLPSAPPRRAEARTWTFRRADLDQFGHVNNAVHWAIVEESLQRGGIRRRGVGELEYLAAADADQPCTMLTDGDLTWVVSDGRPLTVARWTALDES
jgi:acyl-ACP thioesterase